MGQTFNQQNGGYEYNQIFWGIYTTACWEGPHCLKTYYSIVYI